MTFAMARYESRLRQLAAVVKRDAFIVSQLVAASADLNDFQTSVAISKADDRIVAAQKRAAEEPVAPQSTQQMLMLLRDPLLKNAREQGTMVDISAVRKEIFGRTTPLEMELLREVDAARRDRQALTELQARLGAAAGQLDDALGEALGSSFDFVRAVGK